jgi:hypothetical protein
MMSIPAIRNAASMSVRRATVMRSAPMMHRMYTTENKDEDKPKEDDAPEVKVELTEEVKKMLSEKDKQISELKVK